MKHDIREFGFEPDPMIEAYKKNVDRTLIREMLKLTVTERLEHLQRMAELHEEFRKSREAARERDKIIAGFLNC